MHARTSAAVTTATILTLALAAPVAAGPSLCVAKLAHEGLSAGDGG